MTSNEKIVKWMEIVRQVDGDSQASGVLAEFGKKRITDHDFPSPFLNVGSENNKKYIQKYGLCNDRLATHI